jgi:hypothetical protein
MQNSSKRAWWWLRKNCQVSDFTLADKEGFEKLGEMLCHSRSPVAVRARALQSDQCQPPCNRHSVALSLAPVSLISLSGPEGGGLHLQETQLVAGQLNKGWPFAVRSEAAHTRWADERIMQDLYCPVAVSSVPTAEIQDIPRHAATQSIHPPGGRVEAFEEGYRE